MSYQIIGDSCLDLTKELKKGGQIRRVPLTLQIDDTTVIDDESFDQHAFIEKLKKSENCPKSSCPSPEAFLEAFDCEADDIFVITLSSHLSGSYNSACLARELYREEHGEKNILVIDSESAAAGETNIALEIAKLYQQGLGFAEVSRQILEYRDQMKTYFVLDTLEPLRKNGRLTGLKAFLATTLNVKPIMGADHGVIIQKSQTRGLSKALARMSEIALSETAYPEEARIVITHVNTPERAAQLCAELQKRAQFAGVEVAEAAGVSTMYAGDGGLILTVGQRS